MKYIFKILILILINNTLFADTQNNKTELGYFKSGELEYKIPIVNGKREGIAELYYITGELKKLTPSHNNLIDGVVKTYYKNKNLESIVPYTKGKINGIGKKYFKSGRLLSTINIENGKSQGIAKQYYETGELKKETFFLNSKREGLSKEYHKNGNIKAETYYKNGKKVRSTNNIDKNKKTEHSPVVYNPLPEQNIYIKNYQDLVNATTDLGKPIDKRWLFVDKNNDLLLSSDPTVTEYVHKYFYFMLGNKVEIQVKNLPSKSMENTMYSKENVFLFKGLNTLFRGGIFAFYYPQDKKTILAKRCVALGGDTLFFSEKSLYLHLREGNQYIREHYKNYEMKNIDNKLFVKNPYKKSHQGIQHDVNVTKTTTKKFPELFDMKQISIPKDECFMIGDNRDHSNDSRFFGSINQELILGVIVPIKFKSTN